MSFELIDEALFEALCGQEYGNIGVDTATGYCCGSPMAVVDFEYKCVHCGKLTEYDGENVDHGAATNGNLRIASGVNKGRYYNTIGDYSKTQYRDVLELLMANAKLYTGPAIPNDILVAAAKKYNELQQMLLPVIIECENGEDADKHQVSQQTELQKFVKRGVIRAEILANLIEFYCDGRCPRAKNEIAKFMQLPTDGFSRGRAVLDKIIATKMRMGDASGIPDIVVGQKTADILADRYLEALGISPENAAKFIPFIRDIVALAESKKVCVSSRLSSKVVGVIWILNIAMKLNITSQQLEKNTDNTKKNTFMKFHDAVTSLPELFRNVFITHGIPWVRRVGR